jgi:serine/threonine-protein kinase
VVETPATLRTGATKGTAAHNPETVLRRLEIEQTRNLSITGMVFNAVALVAAPFIDSDPLAWKVFMVAAAAALSNNAYRYFNSTEERYREKHLFLFIAISAITNSGAVYYLGVFGPVLTIFVIDQYNACLYYGRRVAFATLIAGCAPVVCIGGLYMFGALDDPGLITAVAVGPETGALFVAIFVLLMITIYSTTLKTRQVTVASLSELDAAVRLASRREALFLEARQDLEKALRAGGLGRFSEQVLGSFELGAVIGRGGMGEVYAAVHVETGEPAAVKMLLPEVLSRPEYVRRFLREVRIAASLESPHVVQVFEVGDESAPLPYLAMELLHGENLAQILRRERRFGEEDAVSLVRQVARGIEAASEAGIVHRDIKPQNLFLTHGKDGVWKILDFGISKPAGSEAMTKGEVLGTPQYMAPEQIDGTVDARADVYGLAAVAYRALTGRQPFVGTEFAAIVVDVVSKMPVKPTSLVTSLHSDVDLALAIGLTKRPADRFATATQLADALDAALGGRLDRVLRARARTLLGEMPWQVEAIETL